MGSTDLSAIGARIVEFRKQCRLNQEDFAARHGVSRNSQIDYEKGKTAPSATYLASLASCGANVNYLLTGLQIDETIFDALAFKDPNLQFAARQSLRHANLSEFKVMEEASAPYSIAVESEVTDDDMAEILRDVIILVDREYGAEMPTAIEKADWIVLLFNDQMDTIKQWLKIKQYRKDEPRPELDSANVIQFMKRVRGRKIE